MDSLADPDSSPRLIPFRRYDHPSFRCSQVDIERFGIMIKEIEAALGARLFAVATQPGQLDDCFWEALELVASAGVLLGCPENEQER